MSKTTPNLVVRNKQQVLKKNNNLIGATKAWAADGTCAGAISEQCLCKQYLHKR